MSGRVPFDSVFLGPLDLVDVFMRHDIPRLFSCRSPAGALYLAQWADEIRDGEDDVVGDSWLVVAVSAVRLEAVRTGSVPLREAFRHAESDSAIWIDARYRRPCEERRVSLRGLESDLFHAEGVRLQLPPNESPAPIRSVPEAAAALGQTVANIVVGVGEDVAMRLGQVSGFLGDLAGVLELLGGSKGTPAFAFRAAWEGSFAIQISGDRQMPGSLFGLEDAEGAALATFVQLLGANYGKQQLADVIGGAGITAQKRLQQRFLRLVQYLSLAETNVAVEWSTPLRSEGGKVSLTADQLRFMYAGLRTVSKIEPTSNTIKSVGVITNYNKDRQRITILSSRGKLSQVSYAKDARALSEGFLTEGLYEFVVTEEITLNDEGEASVVRSLESSRLVDERSDSAPA